ncbi:MAG: hypothetical protein ACK56I_27760, partial [bacterium]
RAQAAAERDPRALEARAQRLGPGRHGGLRRGGRAPGPGPRGVRDAGPGRRAGCGRPAAVGGMGGAGRSEPGRQLLQQALLLGQPGPLLEQLAVLRVQPGALLGDPRAQGLELAGRHRLRRRTRGPDRREHRARERRTAGGRRRACNLHP